MPENKLNFFQKNAELFVLIGLVAMCVAVYAQAVSFQFINFDDNFYVYDNAIVLSGINLSSIKWAFTAFHSANWHPLTWISHMLDVSLFGANAGAHHATNIVFHIVNSFLAFIVFRRMTGSFWKSAIVAALFAVHPAHVESVAWVSERKDVLSTLFWLLTMLAYFNYVRLQQGRPQLDDDVDESQALEQNTRGRSYYFLTIVLFALGLMSKPMLVTLPFVLLLCDFWALERLKKLKDLAPLIIEKLPLFILSAVSAYITIIAQRSYGAVQTLDVLPVGTRFLNALVAYAKYIAMLFYPVDLGVAYPYQATFPLWQIFGAIILLAGITAFCIWQRRNRKYLLFGWLWFLGTLVPVIGIVQVGAQSMADRYTYVPYFGLFIMLTWGAWDLLKRFSSPSMSAGLADGEKKALTNVRATDKKPIAVGVIVLVVLSALCFLSFKQVSYWRNAVTIYEHTLAAGQGNFIIKLNFCNALLRENRLAEAEKQCLDSIAEDATYADAYQTLGVVFVNSGKQEDAVTAFKRSLELAPNNPEVLTNIAAPLLFLGRPEEAEPHLNKVAEIYKKTGASQVVLTYPYSSLAAGYAVQKRYDKASEILARVLQLAPEKADVRANYALMLYFQDKFDDARREIEQSTRQNPNQPESYNVFGLILLKQNLPGEAAKQFEKAIGLKPDFTEAKENLKKAKGETKN
jgi:Tfp pilus assembly protein PilF